MQLGRKMRLALLCVGLSGVAVASWAGVAAAVSGGGYQSSQQDCPNNGSAWNTPNGYTYPGCHNTAVNVESGGTTNGDANSNNTRYAEWGNNQSPNENSNPGFGLVYNTGDPGTYDAIHSGCIAANTDGTGGGAGKGCGNNKKGTGFEANYDYYALYCPVAAMLPVSSTPDPGGFFPAAYQCASDQPVGQNTLTPDTGSGNALTTILTQGVLVYFGMDDNTDNGEHDGFSGNNNTAGAIVGPSDGGSMLLSVTPQTATKTPSATNPEGAANYSMGFCADGICGGATTQQQTVYQGCNAKTGEKASSDKCAKGTAKNDNVYENNTPASTKESPNCNGGGPNSSETACYKNSNGTPNPGGADAYRQNTPQNMNTEPGVQTYQDPDPQRSPAAPVGTPGLYVGSCGAYANDSGGAGSPGITGQDPGYIGGTSNC
ncbi:MAG TPA: hypothetical protein VMR97_10795 [Acidimicrobiales bacterium]|nr:hypothetical protein [Acidimicrobiales bacterium]